MLWIFTQGWAGRSCKPDHRPRCRRWRRRAWAFCRATGWPRDASSRWHGVIQLSECLAQSSRHIFAGPCGRTRGRCAFSERDTFATSSRASLLTAVVHWNACTWSAPCFTCAIKASAYQRPSGARGAARLGAYRAQRRLRLDQLERGSSVQTTPRVQSTFQALAAARTTRATRAVTPNSAIPKQKINHERERLSLNQVVSDYLTGYKLHCWLRYSPPNESIHNHLRILARSFWWHGGLVFDPRPSLSSLRCSTIASVWLSNRFLNSRYASSTSKVSCRPGRLSYTALLPASMQRATLEAVSAELAPTKPVAVARACTIPPVVSTCFGNHTAKLNTALSACAWMRRR